MTQMLDCVVSYFGLDENDRPTFSGTSATTSSRIRPNRRGRLCDVTTLSVYDVNDCYTIARSCTRSKRADPRRPSPRPWLPRCAAPE